MQQTSTEIIGLIADIGGTNARFALVDAGHHILNEQTLACSDYTCPATAATAYLQSVGVACPKQAAFAVATPVMGDQIEFTNSPWLFSTRAVQLALNLKQLTILNDFTALALALPQLNADERRAVGGETAVEGAPIGLIGPGTGLGVSGLVCSNKRWMPLQTEGGHMTFSPTDEREWAIGQLLWQRFGHTSLERLLSGPGLVNLYEALAQLEGWSTDSLAPADITEQALSGQCQHCTDTLETFCGILGTAAGNLALTLGARGGIYIGGGIVPQLGHFFDHSTFRKRFESKGRFKAYLEPIPSWVITADNPAFRGVATALY
ncbi:MAG: glucokinase [Candidatus Contendobacter odensis]|uniref:Glucokinase n=1 Tax=Candidatus Contendibacter odensensis TaxID=1400860 RepID=A0A2G6PF78_9GAMM|nr:MAG: glucokinase [Candidatus Contendobacter odensis]